MTAELNSSEFSLPWSQPTQTQQQVPSSSLKQHRVTCLLIVAGFYFVIFAVVELVTNVAETSFEADLLCGARECLATFQDIGFPKQDRIYLYLISSKISQKLPDPVYPNTQQTITSCSNAPTNAQWSRLISIAGTSLDPGAQAQPCGQTSLHYPQGTLTMKNKQTQVLVTIGDSDLAVAHYGFTNGQPSQQWADVETGRFEVWSEGQVGLGVRKYWGHVDEKVSGDYEVQLTAVNQLGQKFAAVLKIQLTDNKALDGENVSLCAFQFVWAVLCFFLAGFSFCFAGRSKGHNADAQGTHTEKENIFAPIATIAQNSIFVHSLRSQP